MEHLEQLEGALAPLLAGAPARESAVALAPLLLLLLLLLVLLCRPPPPSPEQRWAPGSTARRRLDALRAAEGHFPPPYPNGWYHICDSAELDHGRVLSVSALGREFVAFRGEDGRAGVLHAFCPHLGTHLGHGGVVQGNTLVCPYHEWKFTADGCNRYIPYLKRGPAGAGPTGHVGTPRVNAKAYEVQECGGHVFAWVDVDDRPPRWALSICREFEGRLGEVAPGAANRGWGGLGRLGRRLCGWVGCCRGCCGGWSVVGRGQAARQGGVMLMHVMEPSQNSADWYHFLTVHQWLGGMPSWLQLKLGHSISATYGAAVTPERFKDGREVGQPGAGEGGAQAGEKEESVAQVVRHPKSKTRAGQGAKQEEEGDGDGDSVATEPKPAYYDGAFAREVGDTSAAGGGVKLPSHVLLINEEVTSIRVWGLLPMPRFIAACFSTQVEIQGPQNVLFRVNFPFGAKFRAVMTLLPTAPFCVTMRFAAYTTAGVPWVVGRLLLYFIINTVEQDRQVWEHKMHVAPRNTVSGDGPFGGYGRWLSRFYSDRSLSCAAAARLAGDSMEW